MVSPSLRYQPPVLRLITPWSLVPSWPLDYRQACSVVLERANPFAQSLTQLGKLLRPEYKQGNTENYKQMRWLKQTCKHNLYPISRADSLMHKDIQLTYPLRGDSSAPSWFGSEMTSGLAPFKFNVML